MLVNFTPYHPMHPLNPLSPIYIGRAQPHHSSGQSDIPEYIIYGLIAFLVVYLGFVAVVIYNDFKNK